MFFSIRKVNQNIDPLFRKPKKDFEPSGKTEITFEGVELIRNDEIFRDQGQGSTDIFNCLPTFFSNKTIVGGLAEAASGQSVRGTRIKMQRNPTSLIFQHQFSNRHVTSTQFC